MSDVTEKHTPTPWYFEKFDLRDGNRDFRLYGNKKKSGCGYRIMDVVFHENSPLGRDMAHAVKCVNEHEALTAERDALLEQTKIYSAKQPPKNGARVLVFIDLQLEGMLESRSHWKVACYDKNKGFLATHLGRKLDPQPTKWMFLPPKPTRKP